MRRTRIHRVGVGDELAVDFVAAKGVAAPGEHVAPAGICTGLRDGRASPTTMNVQMSVRSPCNM